MWIKEAEFNVKLGTNTFINVPILVLFKDEPLFGLYRSEIDGQVSIDFEVYDVEKRKVASVRRNNIYPHHEHARNYRLAGTVDTLQLIDEGCGVILVEICKRAAATSELDVYVKTYLPDGRFLDASPDGWSLPGLLMKNCTIKDSRIGIAL